MSILDYNQVMDQQLASYNFFIPLPEAIDVPDGYGLCIESIDDRNDDPAIRYKNDDGLQRKVQTCMEFRRLEALQDTRSIQLGLSAYDLFSTRIVSKKPHFDERLRGFATVVRVAVAGGRNTDGKRVSSYFDLGLAELRQFLKTHYAVHRRPLTLPSRQNLGGFIVYSVESIGADGRPIDSGGDSSDLRILITGGPVDLFSTDEVSVSEEEVYMLTDQNVNDQSTLLRPYLDAYREACAAELQGEHIAASILFAAAVEIFFDTVLQLMIWEEGTMPEEACCILFKTDTCACKDCDMRISSTYGRVKNRMYEKRLGGDWRVFKSPIMKQWEALRYLRNDAVHSGYEPAETEVRDAHGAVDDVVSWVLDRITDNMATYPVTLYALAGRAGIEKRNKWAAYEALDKGSTPRAVAYVFGNWRREMMRHHPHAKGAKIKDEECDLVCVLHQNGKRYWVLCDFTQHLFRYVDPPKISSAMSQLLLELESKHRAKGRVKSLTVRIDEVGFTSRGKKTWYPLYLLSSDYAISRYPVSYLMPGEHGTAKSGL